MFWTSENDFFQFFAYIWVTKLKLFSWKARKSLESFLNPKLFKASILESNVEATLRPETSLLIVWNRTFHFFADFWVTKLKSFSWKSRQCFKILLNKDFFDMSSWKIGFQVLFGGFRQSLIGIFDFSWQHKT